MRCFATTTGLFFDTEGGWYRMADGWTMEHLERAPDLTSADEWSKTHPGVAAHFFRKGMRVLMGTLTEDDLEEEGE